MIKIIQVSIARFRSISKIEYNINEENNLIAFCGQNNIGKTNTLRAINLFFNPKEYETELDMPRIKNATGGGAIHPKINIIFHDTDKSFYYSIIRNIKDFLKDDIGLKGEKFERSGNNKINKQTLNEEEIKNILNNFEFVYIESINTLMPELIEKLTSDMIDVEYDKARFSESKKILKEAYDIYRDGLQEILNSFARDISETFQKFQDNWSVKFILPNNSETFRGIISDDVSLQLDDSGNIGIIDKGAGLQRLTTILLNFEMLSRLHNKKQVIACIDEPDVYLHEGLQRKLKSFFDENAKNMQLFITTHSKVFINPYNMKNVFLLSSKTHVQYSVRKRKDINVKETILIDITEEEGYNQICHHLGIEKVNYEVLQPFNLLVEGDCDKKYLRELCKYFTINVPNIISLNGADNAIKFLEFYESYYKDGRFKYKPKIKVLFDNDSKGREVFKKVNAKNYNNIYVKCILIQNYAGNACCSLEKNTTNNEIEDFIYPELVCNLTNSLLEKKE